jgi:hypothetical protein
MAQDRLWQMDLLRRVARASFQRLWVAALPLDKKFRLLRFAVAAERDVTLLDEESRTAMEAYTRGVNKFIEQHQNKLPVEFTLLKYKPEPWKPADSLVIAAYMYETLTESWEDELDRAKVTARVGAERARDLYSQDAAMDHFVVGDPDRPADGSKRSGNDPDDEDDDDDMGQDDVLKASASPRAQDFPDGPQRWLRDRAMGWKIWLTFVTRWVATTGGERKPHGQESRCWRMIRTWNWVCRRSGIRCI